MATTTIVPNFGSNRMLAHRVGELLKGCAWVGIPFAGGMSEVPHIDARTINVNDAHRHLINLATIMADPATGPALYRYLRRKLFHPEELETAQDFCRHQWGSEKCPELSTDERVWWAADYFITAWMSRHDSALTDREFKAGMSVRWNANGGDSAKHYWSAVSALPTWRRTFRRCNFTCLDFRNFLSQCLDRDAAGHGIYCDPPWPDDGAKYSHKFTEDDHRRLASLLESFQHARIVLRYGDHPLIRELYQDDRWTWHELDGRTQTNAKKAEVLITRRAA